MNRIRIFDTTLRDGEQSPGCSMNNIEKLEMAKQLERLGVDVIEAGFAIVSDGDFESVKGIAEVIKDSSVCSLSRALKGDIDASYNAIRGAANPLIHIFLAASDIHLEYKLKMSRERMLETAVESIKYARTLCPNVEFSAEDASRSDREFLFRLLSAVIAAGATIINIPDTVGYAAPEDMYALIDEVVKNVNDVEKAIISVHCHNDLGLGVANSLAAVRAGATQVECTLNGIGERAGNAALEEIVMALHTRKEYYQAETSVRTQEIYRSSKLLQRITGVNVQPNKAIVGANAFLHESGIHQHGVLANRLTYEILSPQSVGIRDKDLFLGKHSGRHAFTEKLKIMGFEDLDKETIDGLFTEFKRLADKKKVIVDRDIEAIIYDRNISIEETYALEGFVINSGNTITSTAILKLKDNAGNVHEMVELGDGPIDASFKSINSIIGMDCSLNDFKISSVTEGADALGEVRVKLGFEGLEASGTGLSTDILEACIKAYLAAVNALITRGKNK